MHHADMNMEPVVPSLYSSTPRPLSFDSSIAGRAFLLQREAGNLLVYSTTDLEADADAIAQLGGLTGQYLNHRHEASPSSAWAAEAFGAPLHTHEAERETVAPTSAVAETFSDRHMVGDDFEVIPAPGHTAGATAYLWDSGEHRVLFPGDTVMLRDGRWQAAVLAGSDRDAYLASLERIRDLDFDVLAPWATHDGQPSFIFTSPGEAQRQLSAMIDRLRAGETR
jgi:glyoxylase-like metal-dependent hydrolase (beta-lactamase superfamily II)